MNRRYYVIKGPESRRLAAQACMEAQSGESVRFCKRDRTSDQNAHYHALIGDIAKQYTHAGRRWNRDDMKRLLVDAFKHETADYPDLAELWQQLGNTAPVPAIGRDGFVLLGEQTRRFPAKLASAFIDWLYAFGAEQGVVWSDPRWQQYLEGP